MFLCSLLIMLMKFLLSKKGNVCLRLFLLQINCFITSNPPGRRDIHILILGQPKVLVPAAGAIYFARYDQKVQLWIFIFRSCEGQKHISCKILVFGAVCCLSRFLQTALNTRILQEMGFWHSDDLKIKIHGSNLLAMMK